MLPRLNKSFNQSINQSCETKASTTQCTWMATDVKSYYNNNNNSSDVHTSIRPLPCNVHGWLQIVYHTIIIIIINIILI